VRGREQLTGESVEIQQDPKSVFPSPTYGPYKVSVCPVRQLGWWVAENEADCLEM
jgi:hypothetical protein